MTITLDRPKTQVNMPRRRRPIRTEARDLVRLRDMRRHAAEAVEFVAGRARQDLESNRMLELALIRLIEVIGEAAKRLSEEGRQQLPDIAWPQIMGMRNRLVHEYDTIDLNILWETVVSDLPPLIVALDSFLDAQPA